MYIERTAYGIHAGDTLDIENYEIYMECITAYEHMFTYVHKCSCIDDGYLADMWRYMCLWV